MINKLKAKKPDVIYHKYLKIFLSTMITQFLNILFAFIDGIISSNMLSTNAFKAIQICAPLMSFIAFFGNLCAIGLVAKYFSYRGGGHIKRAKNLAGTGLLFACLISLISSLILFFVKDVYIGAFQLPPEINKLASDYYIWFVGVAVLSPFSVLFSYFIANDCDAQIQIASAVSLCVVKCILSITLIRYMGVMGLGLSTLISYTVAIAILIIHFFRKRNSVFFSFHILFKDLFKSIWVSLGFAFSFLLSSILSFILNYFIVFKFGSDYLAVFSLLNLTASLGGLIRRMPVGMSPFISSAYGSKNNDDLIYCIKILKKDIIRFCPIALVVVCALSPVMPLLYNISFSSSFYVLAVLTVVVSSLAYIPTLIVRSFILIYTSLEKSYVSLLNELFTFAFFLLLATSFSYLWGFIGFSIGYALSTFLVMGVLLLIIYFVNRPHVFVVQVKNGEEQFSIDAFLDDSGIRNDISLLKNKLDTMDLNENNKDLLLAFTKEMLNAIKTYNIDKLVSNRTTYCIGKDTIRIINKNNGRILTKQEKHDAFKNTIQNRKIAFSFTENDCSLFNLSSLNCAIVSLAKL